MNQYDNTNPYDQILPAARLLDTIETQVQDFHLIQTEKQNPLIPSSSKEKRTKEDQQNKSKTINKMAIRTYISIITL